MAAFAIVEVGFAEGALAVVAGHTALGARGWKMLRWLGRADLTRLRQPAPSDRVAAIAIEIAAHIVSRVAEAQTKGARRCGCRRVATRAVARPA